VPRTAPVPEAWAAAAADLPSGIHLGTSSWSFPGWQDLVFDDRYSEAILAREGLAAYSRHPLFRLAGVDRTYYAPVPAELYRSWRTQVPGDFRFLVKCHEETTVPRFPDLPRYGERRGRENPRFLDPVHAAEQVVAPYVEGLGARGAALVFQFSPLRLADFGGPEGFADRLEGFLEALPAGPLYAVEIRNHQLLVPAYMRALESAGACHCYNVHSSMPGLPVQRERLRPRREPAIVVRWMLGRGLRYGQALERYAPFDRIVDEDPQSRAEVGALCVEAHGRRIPAYVTVNNKAEGSSPLSVAGLAVQIVKQLEAGE
jgi:uncharacterized protein YecE (DUF72 family)